MRRINSAIDSFCDPVFSWFGDAPCGWLNGYECEGGVNARALVYERSVNI